MAGPRLVDDDLVKTLLQLPETFTVPEFGEAALFAKVDFRDCYYALQQCVKNGWVQRENPTKQFVTKKGGRSRIGYRRLQDEHLPKLIAS